MPRSQPVPYSNPPTRVCVIRSGTREQNASAALRAIPNKLQNIVSLCQEISLKNYAEQPDDLQTLQLLKYDLHRLCQHLLDLKLHWQDHYYYHLIARQKTGENNTTPYDPIRVIQSAIEHSISNEDAAEQFDFYLKVLNKLTRMKNFHADTPEAIRDKVWKANPASNHFSKAISFTVMQKNSELYKKIEEHYIAAKSVGWKACYKKTADEATTNILKSHFDFIYAYKYTQPEDKKFTFRFFQEECKPLLMTIAAVGEIFATFDENVLSINGLEISKDKYKHFISVRNSIYSFDKPLIYADLRQALIYVDSFYDDRIDLDQPQVYHSALRK